MYCKNCGSEMKTGERICPQCGAESDKKLRKTLSLTKIKCKLPERYKPLQTKLEAISLANYLIVALLVASLFILWGDVFQVSYKLLAEEKIKIPMFPQAPTMRVWRICYFHGYLMALFLMVLPLIQEKSWRKWNFVGAFVMPVAALLWLLSFCLMLMQEGTAELANTLGILSNLIDLKINLSVSGWLFVLISLAVPVISSFEMKKLKN